MTISEFQRRIEAIYFEKDSARGVEGDFRWFVEEVGELARALRSGDKAKLQEEFADCLAWLSTLASITGIELADAISKYQHGCPKCGRTPCGCGD
jgi:NTP pyrophosphatase (non-canonical NTP hydrolase)